MPIKASYEIGDNITCYADAYPAPTYIWFNSLTGASFSTQKLIFDDTFVGSQQLRCNAENTIDGQVYTSDLLVSVIVNRKPFSF